MRLKGKVAIVTGAARGLGKAYALCLAEEGASVVVTDILDTMNTKSEIAAKGGETMALHVDVSIEEETQVMARKTIEQFGRIDILVNNAGIFADINKKPFVEIPLQEWEKLLRINLTGTFLCCQAVFPQMKKQGKGKIINVTSSTHFFGVPFLAHYVTSKGAIIALTRTLAREAGADGISVNAIAPGFTISDAIEGNKTFPEQSHQRAVDSRCFKRNELPEDLVGTIVFLASDDSDFITGQTIVVDGGDAFN
jgi:NAD(P)-dependent dehydrogenase (short-subunit alcohol dehydrogenase family)